MLDPKNGNIFTTEVQLILEDELTDFSVASRNLNPLITYVRFILTDDKPNSNGVRIPRSEFASLIRTGIFMPIKMAEGKIADGHEGSIPLGVITHLREDNDTIRGVAGLWNRERPSDISYIKERYAEGRPLDLSWEIGFEDYEEDEAGIKNLKGCVLRGTTLVGMPAYGHGRTSITEVEMSDDGNSQEDNKVTEMELQNLQEKIEALEAEVSSLKENQLTEEDKQKLEEYPTLVEFKQSIEAEAAKLQQLEEIKQKFSQAGIEKEDEYFTVNESSLLALIETDTLDFFISNLADETSSRDDGGDDEEDNSEENSSTIPPIVRKQEQEKPLTTTELAKALRQRKSN